MKNIICLCSLLAVLFANVCSSIAKVDITPSVALREEYNDNLFLTESSKDFDYITKISPDILIEYSPGSSLDLSLDYRLDFRFYSRHSKFNDTDPKDTQNVNLRLQAKPMNYLFIDASDNYKRVPIDIRRKTALDNELRNMTDNNIFMISPYTVLPLSSTLSTTVGYRYNNIWYDSRKNVGSDSHTGFFKLTDKFSSKLSGELNYDYYKYLPRDVKHRKFIEDYDKHSGSVGLTYLIGSRLTVNGQVGESYLNYETRGNTQYTFWNINADYNMSTNASFGAGYRSTLNDSSISGTYKSHRTDMYFKTQKPVTLSINPYYSHDDYLDSRREDKVTGINADITYVLTKKMDLLFNGLWERQKFSPKDKKVDKYSIGSSLQYKLSTKITSSVGYRYNNSNSNIDSEDYENNIAWVQAKVVF
jgi:hypothetical protein